MQKFAEYFYGHIILWFPMPKLTNPQHLWAKWAMEEINIAVAHAYYWNIFFIIAKKELKSPLPKMPSLRADILCFHHKNSCAKKLLESNVKILDILEILDTEF